MTQCPVLLSAKDAHDRTVFNVATDNTLRDLRQFEKTTQREKVSSAASKKRISSIVSAASGADYLF